MNDLPISVFAYMLVLLNGCFGYTKVDQNSNDISITDADNLRKEIIYSIRNPFPQAEAFIVQTSWRICGNGEAPVVFDIKLEEINHINSLSQQLNLPIIPMTEFQKVMDTVRMHKFKGEYPPSLWNTCRIGKVAANIRAKRLSSKRVIVYENYLYNNINKNVEKEFTFDNNKWTFEVIYSSTPFVTKH